MSECQEILERFTARQLRLGFLTQLWNSKVDFSESLMTGEVRNLETTINVCHIPAPSYWSSERSHQNFFTTVKALVNQANGEGMTSDGHHHFEQPEQELLLRYCLVDLCPWTLILVYSFQVYTRVNPLSEQPSAILLIPLRQSMSSGILFQKPMSTSTPVAKR